jgi:hypothetical protein
MQRKLVVMVALLLSALTVLSALHFSSAEAGPSYDGFQPTSPGLHYDPPTGPPKITEEQAIEAAKAFVPLYIVPQATRIVARYVLFSDNVAHSTDADGQKHYLWQKMPSWVVTFEGVNFRPLSSGPPPRPGEPPRQTRYFHEVNVVVDANTGVAWRLFAHMGGG